jgi:hypothetical protein
MEDKPNSAKKQTQLLSPSFESAQRQLMNKMYQRSKSSTQFQTREAQLFQDGRRPVQYKNKYGLMEPQEATRVRPDRFVLL